MKNYNIKVVIIFGFCLLLGGNLRASFVHHTLIVPLYNGKTSNLLFFASPLKTSPFNDLLPSHDTLPETNLISTDTLPEPDSATVDSDLADIPISKDAINVKAQYFSRDSVVYSAGLEKLFMYTRDSVVTKDATLTSEYMEFDIGKSEVKAEGSLDSAGRMYNNPRLVQGENKVDATTLKYNFDSEKAYIKGARTKESDLYIVGNESKYLTETHIQKKDTVVQDVIYNARSILTTCDHPTPHFGLRSGKQKIIANEWAVMGPSYIEIGGIPTPLVLPLAAAPLTKGRRTGLLFPRDYDVSPQWGYGLRNIGYYFPINEFYDLSVTTDIYLRGSFGLRGTFRYNRRYAYSGNAAIAYSSYKTEFVENNSLVKGRDNSFSIQWSHNQDPKAHPLRTFSANVNIQTNDYARLNRNDANSVLQNSFSSRINYNQRFKNKNWNLTASFNHSQNNQTGEVQLELPQVSFATNAFKPFEKTERIGQEKWYEKVTMNYSVDFRNSIRTSDSLLFTQEVFDDMKYGFDHRFRADANFRLFKYFTVTPNVNYNETWVFETLRLNLIDTPIITNRDTMVNPANPDVTEIVADTIFNRVEEDLVSEFRSLRTFNAGVNMNTQIFGTLRFKKGWLRGVRHVIKPNFSFSYSPDFSDPFWNYYDTYESDLRENVKEAVQYSIFEGNVFGARPGARPSMILNYNLNNIFEAKYYSKKADEEKNFKLFQNFVVSGSYDFLRDSLKFSDVSMRGFFSMAQGIINFRFNGSFSPYALNEEGNLTKRFQWTQERQLLRFQNLNMDIATRFSVKQMRTVLKESFLKNGDAPNAGQSENQRKIWTLVDDVRVTHNLSLQWRGRVEADTFFVRSNQLSFQGQIPISEKWNIQVGRIGYDFKQDRMTYPDLGFTRDLHCWELSLRWQPEINTYMFSIGTKPGSLDFLSLPYRRNRADGAALF
jgi:hypothetical protein